MSIKDQHSDKSRALLVKCASRLNDQKLAEQVLAAGLEKKASTSNEYAWEDASLFPVGTPEETAVSRVYFNGQREKIASAIADKIDARLSAFEELHGIHGDFSLRKLEKKAADDAIELLPGYTVHGDAGLEKAGKEFIEKKAQLSISDRAKFANAYIKEAAMRGLRTPDEIVQYTGMYSCDPDMLSQALSLRKTACWRAGMDGRPFVDLAEALGKADVQKATFQEKVAMTETIGALDAKFGLDSPYYDNRLPNAWESVFNTKTAEDDDASAVKIDPQSMTKADIAARYGDEAVDALDDGHGNIDRDRLAKVVQMLGGQQ